MPSNFDLPRKDKSRLGELLHIAINSAKEQDLTPPFVMSQSVRRYLSGERNFTLVDPWDVSNDMLEVTNPRNQPPYEALVSDTAQEVGRQQRVDMSPTVEQDGLTLNSIRDSAVGFGVLKYLFPDWVVEPAHRLFQQYRVIDGAAGLAVESATYPGVGWGLKITPIPIDELIFLPVGAEDRGQANTIVWRRWVTLTWLRNRMKKFNKDRDAKLVSVPAEGSPAFEDMMVREIVAGNNVKEELRKFSQSGILIDRSRIPSSSHKTDSKIMIPYVEFSQVYISPDWQHVEREIFIAGQHVLHDKEYPEHEQPQTPVAAAVYADVGGPYGRSYAYAKMMAHIPTERMIGVLTRNADEIDAYGKIAYSTGMGIDLEDMERSRSESTGFAPMQYTVDPMHQAGQPLQIMPVPLSQILGQLPAFTSAVGGTVFPSSPLFGGQAPGRTDSAVGFSKLEELSQVQIAAGAASAAAAFEQMYRAGLDLAREHFQEGSKIPIFMLDDALAGVILDVEEVPLSRDEEREALGKMEERASRIQDSGLDPNLVNAIQGDEPPQQPVAVPVGRFKIGPNVIPHPDRLNIKVKSLLPRDKSNEFAQLVQATQMGGLSLMELQIEVKKRGLGIEMGGKANWNTYKGAILNLLSAYGNGVEAGPIVIQFEGVVRRVGFFVVFNFMADPRFSLASDTVKQKIRELMQTYSLVNQADGSPSADEAAIMQSQVDQLRQRGVQGFGAGGGPAAAPPQLSGASGQLQPQQ